MSTPLTRRRPPSIRRNTALAATLAALLAICGLLPAAGCDGTTSSETTEPLFSDDFANDDEGSFPDGWTQRDYGLDDTSPPGNWYVNNGALYQDADAWGGSEDPYPYWQNGTVLAAGDENWTDYRFSVEITPEHANGVGVMFRLSYFGDSGRYYYRVFIMQSNEYGGPYWRLDRRGPTVSNWLVRNDGQGYTVGETFKVIVEARGHEIKVYNGNLENLVLEWNGGEEWDELPNGQIGLMCYRQPGISFDNVLVEPLE
jgi:hypothetical protein